MGARIKAIAAVAALVVLGSAGSAGATTVTLGPARLVLTGAANYCDGPTCTSQS